ncbi:MAG: T9SS type A sorting domain-containing protein, partial [Bacteroidales bacterium]|nr:T9SS type A sorting domain-containing protein [Bacteroidales bacterium]
YTSGGPGRAHSDEAWPAGMPQNFGSSMVYNYLYSIYATYELNASDGKETEEITQINDSSPRIWLFPNPLNNNVLSYTIKGLNKEENFILEIVDATGRILVKDNVKTEPGIINQIKLPKGIYETILIFRLYNQGNMYIEKLSISQAF